MWIHVSIRLVLFSCSTRNSAECDALVIENIQLCMLEILVAHFLATFFFCVRPAGFLKSCRIHIRLTHHLLKPLKGHWSLKLHWKQTKHYKSRGKTEKNTRSPVKVRPGPSQVLPCPKNKNKKGFYGDARFFNLRTAGVIKAMKVLQECLPYARLN